MVEVNHADRSHAFLSASGSSRWLNCTPSPMLEEKEHPHVPGQEEETSDYAAEGTLAHEYADIKLQFDDRRINKRKYNALERDIKKNKFFTSEMESEVDKYVSYVSDNFAEAKRLNPYAELLIEEQLDLSPYIDEGFATNDAIIVSDGVLEVNDLKYGKGIKVYAENNTQLMLYGLGAYYKYELLYDIRTIRVTIIQPRLDHYSTWDISVEELLSWAENEVVPKAILAHKGEGETKAGDWCRWCKVKAQCRTLANKNLELAKLEFEDPEMMTDEELVDAYQQISSIQTWLKSVSEFMLQQALEGRQWPGYKLVEGRASRKWIDEEKVKLRILDINDAITEDQIVNTKLMGITAIEKLLGKDIFNEKLDDLVAKPQGAPTLVVESDKRPEMGIEQAKIDFA